MLYVLFTFLMDTLVKIAAALTVTNLEESLAI
jgi:hypothetical protein